jgi:hypothetical protein
LLNLTTAGSSLAIVPFPGRVAALPAITPATTAGRASFHLEHFQAILEIRIRADHK